MDKWDKRFLELAKHIAQWSKENSINNRKINDLLQSIKTTLKKLGMLVEQMNVISNVPQIIKIARSCLSKIYPIVIHSKGIIVIHSNNGYINFAVDTEKDEQGNVIKDQPTRTVQKYQRISTRKEDEDQREELKEIEISRGMQGAIN